MEQTIAYQCPNCGAGLKFNAEKQCFDLSTPAQRARYRADCRACADSYTALAAATGQRSMRLRAALLRIGLPAYQAFLKHKT